MMVSMRRRASKILMVSQMETKSATMRAWCWGNLKGQHFELVVRMKRCLVLKFLSVLNLAHHWVES